MQATAAVLTLPAKPPAGDTAYTSKIGSLIYFITSMNMFAMLLKGHGFGKRERYIVFTGECLLAQLSSVEMVNVFALLSDGLKLATAPCNCQRVEEVSTTEALISGLEITICMYTYICIYLYIYFLILISV